MMKVIVRILHYFYYMHFKLQQLQFYLCGIVVDEFVENVEDKNAKQDGDVDEHEFEV